MYNMRYLLLPNQINLNGGSVCCKHACDTVVAVSYIHNISFDYYKFNTKKK